MIDAYETKIQHLQTELRYGRFCISFISLHSNYCDSYIRIIQYCAVYVVG